MARVACGRGVARLREAVDDVCLLAPVGFLAPVGGWAGAEAVIGGSGEGSMDPDAGAGAAGFCPRDDVTMAQTYAAGVRWTPGDPRFVRFSTSRWPKRC